MFDKRLLAMVPGAAKYILANVLFQWIALVCNIALFIVIGLFLQATFEARLTPPWRLACLLLPRWLLRCAWHAKQRRSAWGARGR